MDDRAFKYFGTAADGSTVAPVPTKLRRRAAWLAAVVTTTLAAAALPVASAAAPQPTPTPAASSDVAAPLAVALDPTLAKPDTGDSPATRAARTELAKAQSAYAAANQQFDAASAAADAAEVRLRVAERIAALARATSDRADDELASVAVSIYQDGGSIPVEAQILFAADSASVLDDLERAHQIAAYQAEKLRRAVDARAAADSAEATVSADRDAATGARIRALDAERRAAAAVTKAQVAVGALHVKDLLARAQAAAHAAMIAGTARAAGADSAAGAAAALEAQALTSGAAHPADFPSGTGIAATISIAVRALLQKAAALGAAPTDVRSVMGPPPELGPTVPWTGATTTGRPKSLTPFDGHVSHANWPSDGVGAKVPGTAPFLKADGVSINPKLPDYAKGYRPLRAEVAVDEALRQLGSPYVWDAAGPSTFDCSGLTLWAWGHAGVPLTHFTGAQVTEGVQVLPEQMLPGDLVLFGQDLHHVGMYLGAGYMIDAPQTGDYVKVQLVADMGDFAVAVRP